MPQYSLSGSVLLELNMVVETDGKAEAIEEASFFLANADETLPWTHTMMAKSISPT